MTTKTKNFLLSLLVVVIASCVPAIVFGKWQEAVIFIFCHTFIRQQFPRQFHHIMPAVCREITGEVFFFGVSFVLPVELSFVSAIPINYLIGWVGNIKADRDYFELQYNKLRDKYCNKKEELLLSCRNAKLSERDTKIALMYYYEFKTPKEIWLWLCDQKQYESVEWDYIYVLLNRIGKKIENNSK